METLSVRRWNINDSSYDSSILPPVAGSGFDLNESDFANTMVIGCQICTVWKCTIANVTYVDDEIDTFAYLSLRDSVSNTTLEYTGYNQGNYTLWLGGDWIDNQSNNHTGTVNNYNDTTYGFAAQTGEGEVPSMLKYSDYINSTLAKSFFNINVTPISFYYHKQNFTDWWINESGINGSNSFLRVYMARNKMNLIFVNDTLGLVNVTGQIGDTEKVIRFNNTSAIAWQQNMSLGKVSVLWGEYPATGNGNWTQRYEYINDYSTNINETILVLDKADWNMWIRVVSESGSPITNSVIRATSRNATFTWRDYYLTTRSLTDDRGMSQIYADTGTEIALNVMKDGYDTYIGTLRAEGGDFTESTPFEIRLVKSEYGSVGGIDCDWYPLDINENTTRIRGVCVAPEHPELYLTTTLMNSTGTYMNLTSTRDELGMFEFWLSEGATAQFIANDTFNITIWARNQRINYSYGTFEVEYDDAAKTKFFDTSEVANNDFFKAGLFFLLIILSGGTAIIFNKKGLENSGEAGAGVFFIGSILIGFLAPAFFLLSFISVLYFILRIIKKVGSE